MPGAPVPGPLRDLLVAGVAGNLTRGAVIGAVRSYMLSCHRAGGWTLPDLIADLTDDRNGLARQLCTGRGGRPFTRRAVAEQIEKHWIDTGKVAAATDPIDHAAILDHLAECRAAADTDDTLSATQRAVLHAVIDLAELYGTTRTVAPARVIAERVGIGRTMASRYLATLTRTGHLTLAVRGNARTRRANLYRVGTVHRAPVDVSGGLTPPVSTPPPMSTPTYVHTTAPDKENPMHTMTLTLDADQHAAVIAALAAHNAEAAKPATPPLRLVHDQPDA